jgi:putative flavoprotein involved in K+ transport
MHETVDTLVIGAGQAGLAISYWLSEAGRDHLVVDRRDTLGGAWQDRWDSFRLVAPNFTIRLPGKPYAGPDPDGFMVRAEILNYVREYAATIGAPVRLRTAITSLSFSDGRFIARTGTGEIGARNVVLATGPYQTPRIPLVAQQVAGHIEQLHSHDYRRPSQLADGGVLVVGTGQSGTQIARELLGTGRDVHLAVSTCPSAPRRYRGRDVIYWLQQVFLHGDEVGIHAPTVTDLPSPAARFDCKPHVGTDLRALGRAGIRLYGALESAAGATVAFGSDLDKRLTHVETHFDQELRPMFDAYIAEAGIDAPPDNRLAPDDYVPPTVTELDLDAAGVSTIIWATGYRLDFGWVNIPVLDEWGYPKHTRGVTIQPGLYAIGLPWLHSEPSAVLAGVGADAEHVATHLVGRG